MKFSTNANKIKKNKYSFIKTSDKPQMNTTATTGISDAGAAPVGHQLQRLPCRRACFYLNPIDLGFLWVGWVSQAASNAEM